MEQTPKYTPWGKPQTTKEVAPGIVRFTTASHGGIWLSEERAAQMPAEYRDTTWTGETQWYEEDCDWARVAVTFPQHFSEKDVKAAEKSLQWQADNSHW